MINLLFTHNNLKGDFAYVNFKLVFYHAGERDFVHVFQLLYVTAIDSELKYFRKFEVQGIYWCVFLTRGTSYKCNFGPNAFTVNSSLEPSTVLMQTLF